MIKQLCLVLRGGTEQIEYTEKEKKERIGLRQVVIQRLNGKDAGRYVDLFN
jgi:hypothetical protein